jgi:hypothetical protein
MGQKNGHEGKKGKTLRKATPLFTIKDFFGEMRCSRRSEGYLPLMNVVRVHYAVCKKCKAYAIVGDNLIGSWRYESKETWKANERFLRTCRRARVISRKED